MKKEKPKFIKSVHNGIESYKPNQAMQVQMAKEMQRSGVLDKFKAAGLDVSAWQAKAKE